MTSKPESSATNPGSDLPARFTADSAWHDAPTDPGLAAPALSAEPAMAEHAGLLSSELLEMDEREERVPPTHPTLPLPGRLPPPDPLRGQLLPNDNYIGGRFERRAILNNGHPYSTEYDGFDLQTGVSCVLERIDLRIFHIRECPEIAQKIIDNINQYKKIHISNLARLIEIIHESSIEGVVVWLAWKKISGSSLMEIIKERTENTRAKNFSLRRFLVSEVLEIGVLTGQALHQLHINGLVHGEISMESIFVSDDDPKQMMRHSVGVTVKVPLSKRAYAARYGDLKSKTIYLVLDRFSNHLSAKGDQFLLAGVMNQLFALEGSARELDRIKPVIERALDPNPEERFASVLEFVGALEACFTGCAPAPEHGISPDTKLLRLPASLPGTVHTKLLRALPPRWWQRVHAALRQGLDRLAPGWRLVRNRLSRLHSSWLRRLRPPLQLNDTYAGRLAGTPAYSAGYDLLLSAWLVRTLGAALCLSLLLVIAAVLYLAVPGSAANPIGAYRPELVILPAENNITVMISRTQITHEQFALVMNLPIGPKDARSSPMTDVSMGDAAEYCNRISAIEQLAPCYRLTPDRIDWPIESTCDGYRLPTYLEWTYAVSARDKEQAATFSALAPKTWQTPKCLAASMPCAPAGMKNAWGIYWDGQLAELVWQKLGVRSLLRDQRAELSSVGAQLTQGGAAAAEPSAGTRTFVPQPGPLLGFRIVRTYRAK